MRLRRAGGAAGQQAHGLQVHGDLWHGAGGRQAQRTLHLQHRQRAGVQRIVIHQQVGRAAGGGDLPQRVGQRIRRHQAGLSAQQRGGQAERKEVAVVAQVDRAAVGQRGRQSGGFGDELPGADGLPGAPGQGLGQRGGGQQRQGGCGLAQDPAPRPLCW
jgi:hypothetical protein